ncbi:MAG: glycosyltransferase family 4 protein [Nitrosomonas ureae]
MRILFLATWFPYPPDNGSKLRVYYLLRALAAEHKVSLLSFAFSTARPDVRGDLYEWCYAVETVPLEPFVVNRAGALATFLSARPMASRPIPAMQQAVDKALQAIAFDAVIASTGMMADYALQAPPKTVCVLEEHNAMTRWAYERYQQTYGGLQRTRAWLSWRKSRIYEKRLYRRFDLITMVSEADRRAAAALLGAEHSRVELTPNGVDCTHNQPNVATRRPNALVFNGSLTYNANYDAMQWFLQHVWPAVRRQVPAATLTITGSTAGVDLSGLALDDHVRLSGLVEDVRLPVAEASAAIAPIRQGGGTRLKILEAMALGTPVVATFKGAEGLEVVNGEHLLLADDPPTFTRAVLTLLTDDSLAARLRHNARRLVEERYDWDVIGRRFTALLSNAIYHKNQPHA